MKLRSLFAFLAVVSLNSMAVHAQDKKLDDLAMKQEHTQVKDRYEQQKKTIDAGYKKEMDALKAQTNLTPAQRKTQREAIQNRYEEQKRANQAAYKTDKDALKTDRMETKEARKDTRVKPEPRPVKAVKPVKTPRPVKH